MISVICVSKRLVCRLKDRETQIERGGNYICMLQTLDQTSLVLYVEILI